MDLTRLTISEIHRGFSERKFSCRELVAAHLQRIEDIEPKVKAFITVAPDYALQAAEKVDHEISAGAPLRALSGVPVAVKDNISTQGLKTTCGSRILADYVPPYSATVVRKLQGAGAVILGKTNCDEFGMGSSTENSAFHVSCNPFALDRVPGGSSGGSAVAVAGYEAVGAFGSDTGGSVRTPAAFCGVYGLKPTYGRVSRYGLVAFSSSLDTIGSFARTVEDLSVLLKVTAGHDPQDMTSHPSEPEEYGAALARPLKSVKVGVPYSLLESGLDSSIARGMERAMEELKLRGCELLPVELPHSASGVAVYYLIAPSEASSNLARYDGVKYGYRADHFSNLREMYQRTRARGFGREVQRRIMLGTYALSSGYYDAYFLKASKVRTLLIQDFQSAFNHCDVILMPTTPTPAFRVGEKTDDPLAMYLTDVFTVLANLAGIPGLSVPAGYSEENLPVAVQLLAGHFQEQKLLNVAYHLEQSFALPPPRLAV